MVRWMFLAKTHAMPEDFAAQDTGFVALRDPKRFVHAVSVSLGDFECSARNRRHVFAVTGLWWRAMHRSFPSLVAVLVAVVSGFSVPNARAQTASEKEKVREILTLALEAVGRIEDSEDRLGKYAVLAKHQAINGDVLEAFASAEKAGDQREDALQFIAQAQAVRGDLAGAEKTAARIKDDLTFSQAIATVAISKARAGDFVGAFQIWEKKIKAFDILEALMLYHGFVRMQIRAGDLKDAARRLKSVPDPALFAFLSTAAAKAGDARNAARYLSDARKAKGGLVSPEGPAGVAIGLIEGGDTAGALRELEPVVASGEGQMVLPEIVQALTEQGDFAGALRAATRIEDRPDRAVAIAQIGRAQVDAGDRVGAAETLRQATAMASDVVSVLHRADALLVIAVARHRLGEKDAASKALGEVTQILAKAREGAEDTDAYLLGEAGKRLVDAWIGVGDVAAALAAARQLPSKAATGFFPRREGLLQIAQAQRRAGRIDEATKMFEAAFAEARTTAGGPEDIDPLASVVLSRSMAGDVDGALAWAKAETRPLARATLMLACSAGILDRDGTYSRTDPMHGIGAGEAR